MATPNPLLLSLISLFSLFHLAFSSKLTLPLSLLATHHSSSDPIQTLSLLSSASLSRAHHLKRPKHSNSSTTKVPLYPRSFGGYSIPLSFGTPPQTSTFVMDTGSSLVWFPCTSRYSCSSCVFPNIDPTHIPTFIPKLSSTSRIVGCKNPKCAWIFGPQINTKCPNSSQACPTYVIQYGSGATAGVLLSESLDLPNKTVPDFLVGCSFLSIRQPAGIAGFGRGLESLPVQMGLSKFSYCLVSRRFDDTPVSSDLVLYSGSTSDDHDDSGGVSYTPFQKNPGASNSAYREYYYLALRKVVVGKKHVKLPYKYLVPGADDNGGTIVDSGSTFTFMERPVFEAVAEAFAAQMVKYTRAEDIENRTGLKPCFDISKEKTVDFPELVFQFKGGAKMALPLSNYFALVTSGGVVCLTIVTDGVAGPSVPSGPAIILGSFQQQNFYVEYDLAHDRFGFRRQSCKK